MKPIFLFPALTTILFGGVHGQVTPGCINNLAAIDQLELTRDPAVRRIYVLCPLTTFSMGLLQGDESEPVPGSGEKYITARPNMEVWCGSDGARENQCVLDGGSLHIDATDFLGGTDTSPIDNVVFKGVTFSDTQGYFVWASRPGSILFEDCEFKNTVKAAAPILLEFFDASSPALSLKTTFKDTDFINNRYFGPGSYTSIVTATSGQNELVFEKSKFSDNDYVFNNTIQGTSSSLVDTTGPVSIESCCFIDNLVGVAPVVVYASTWTALDNYGLGSDGETCNFIADFQNQAQFEFFQPSCFNFQAFDECSADGTRAPSQTPSAMPSAMPSRGPTLSPSDSPSLSPSEQPTNAPTVTASPTLPPVPPTAAPSDAVTSGGSMVSVSVAVSAAFLALGWMV